MSDLVTGTSSYTMTVLPGGCDHEDDPDERGAPALQTHGCYAHDYEHAAEVFCRRCNTGWTFPPSCADGPS